MRSISCSSSPHQAGVNGQAIHWHGTPPTPPFDVAYRNCRSLPPGVGLLYVFPDFSWSQTLNQCTACGSVGCSSTGVRTFTPESTVSNRAKPICGRPRLHMAHPCVVAQGPIGKCHFALLSVLAMPKQSTQMRGKIHPRRVLKSLREGVSLCRGK